jgi:hypothetical protein
MARYIFNAALSTATPIKINFQTEPPFFFDPAAPGVP